MPLMTLVMEQHIHFINYTL